jgi:hypothetical protein
MTTSAPGLTGNQHRKSLTSLSPGEVRHGRKNQKCWARSPIRYTLSRWDGLTRFLDDGRIDIDSNVVERAIRPIALGRKIISSPAPTAAASIGRSSPRSSKPAR